MARTVQVHVQVDRLPNVEDGGDFIQLGLRVSAAIVPDGADVAVAGDDALILPWRWRAKPDAADGTWDPYADTSWQIWRVVKGTPNTFELVEFEILTKAQAGVDEFDEPKFRARIDAEVREIITARGVREALEVPSQTGILGGRTAYGLAESLTSLPSPVPAGMKVWIAATIRKGALVDEDRFVAVPIFAASDTAYTPDAFDGVKTAPFEMKLNAASDGTPRKATALVHGSLPLSALEIHADDKERLIDLANLTIRAKSGQEFEGGDWIAEIGGRIAEAVDPPARAMAVLDATIAGVVARESENGQASATRAALAEDAKKADRFRTALNRLHEPVVRPRARRSDASPAAAAAFLEMRALRTPQLWETVAPLLFAHAGAENEKMLPDPGQALFAATSWSRILAAAGVPPTPGVRLVDAAANPANRVPLLDAEGEFVEWVIRHWTDLPPVVSTKGLRRFEGTLRRLERGSDSSDTKQHFVPVGAVDLTRVPRDEQRVITIPIHFSKAEFPCDVKVRLECPGSGRAGTSVDVLLSFIDDATTRVTIGANAEQTAAGLGVAQLAFRVTIPKGDGPPKLEVVYTGLAPVEIPDAATILAGRIGIFLEATKNVVTGIDAAAIARPSIDRERLSAQAHALRAALSWSHAGAVVQGLLQGWAPIADAPVMKTFEKEPLSQRVAHAIEEYVGVTFKSAFDDAAGALIGPLLMLWNAIRAAAIEDAGRLARALVPPAYAIPDRVTEDALPLAFLIAQLQDFNPDEDLWGRLAGVGVLISRDPEIGSDQWWSLNAATLHVTELENGVRRPFTEKTAVKTVKKIDGKWRLTSKVDPVPLTVADVGGVRSALVKYENHSIVGELEGSPQLDPAGTVLGPRRPEAYLFPVVDFTRMPALTFGREYGIVPHLIAHGGALPLALRETPLNPVKRKKADDVTHAFEAKFKEPGDGYVVARRTKYLRTVPVGAPRLSEAQWPGTFPGVDPLADELPLRPPQITLDKQQPTNFFFDKDRLTGLLSSPSKDAAAAIRIDVGQMELPQNPAADALLDVRVTMLDTGGISRNALKVRVKVATLDGRGLRIEAGPNGHIRVRALKRREDEHADDEPEELPVTFEKAALAVAVMDWSSAFLALTAENESFDVEPPVIHWATRAANDAEILLEGGRPLLPPELAHAARKVTVLDGIETGAKTGPVSVTLTLRRPSTPLATYERWINGPTGKNGNADSKVIRAHIAGARDRASTLGTGDRSFDDPAVEALFVEVVRLFPTRKVALPLMRMRQLKTLADVIAFERTSFCSIITKADPTLLPDDDLKSTFDEAKHTLTLQLARGGIYELRVYGGIPVRQPDLASRVAAERFSPSVRASWRRTADGAFHLGTPLALTFEVATEIMPECWPREAGGDLDFRRPAFAIDLERPPLAVDDRAVVRLVPENLSDPVIAGKVAAGLRYAALRYVNRAALLPQRWSWRGRPHPELIMDEKPRFGTGGIPISDRLGEFVDAAFLDRADDDIGVIREIAFGRAHASGGKAVMERHDTSGSRPMLLAHDLDRRAGAHLWRFALRLKSRYAAMRTNHPAMLRFSHVQPNTRTQWWRLIVPDRAKPGATPRAIDRPSLMLVLPLTEPLMNGGSVPPLLAVFNQELFPMFNAADGMEAVIDVARHPLPGVDGGPKTKYYQEFAPDPVREATAAKRPVAIRVDGPVGYTFDAGVDAGRFDHAALLISPVAEVVRPGSFMRLRFRRFETPRLLVAPDPKTPTDVPAYTTVEITNEGARFLVAHRRGAPPSIDGLRVFPTTYEALAFDLDLPATNGATYTRFRFVRPNVASTCSGKDHTTIHTRLQDDRLIVAGETQFGGTAEWSVKLSEDAKVEMRIVVSLRPKPQKGGTGQTAETFRPVGDVSVRVRITPHENDPVRRPHDRAWLSVLCMPLTTPELFDDAVAVRVCPSKTTTFGVSALRLSDFAPAVWCQFAAAMSSFDVTAKTSARNIRDVLPVDALTVTLENDQLVLGLADRAEGETLQSLSLATVGHPEAASQLEEPLYAVVTRFVHDAFDRLRERAIGIHALDAGLVLGTRLWPESNAEEYTAAMRGRVRFLRVLRGKTREAGGFELTSPRFPADFFGREADEALDADPLDAAGMAMGISMPIEWGHQKEEDE